MQINEADTVTWKGKFRAPLENAHILPQPVDGHLPIWRAVGGPPASAIKAGRAGVPMMLTTLGGPAINFKASVDAIVKSQQVMALIQITSLLGQRVYFIQQKIRKTHCVNFTHTLIRA